MASEPTQEAINEAITPGAVRSVIYYQDDSGEPVAKSAATQAEIHEIDAKGEVIFRTYGQIERS